VFWIGDFVALVVLGPLFGAVLLRLLRHSELWAQAHAVLRGGRLRGAFGYKLVFNVVLVIAVMLIADQVQTYESAFLIFFVLIPQLWLTYTESPMATTVSLAAVSFLVVVLLWLPGPTQFCCPAPVAIAITPPPANF